MAEEKDKEDRFEVESAFYSFNPVFFIDDVINCVEDYSCDGLDAMERATAKLPSFKGKGTVVGSSVDKMLADLNKSMNKNLDKFELYALQNILQLPSNLDLSEHLAASPSSSSSSSSSDRKVYTAEEEKELDAHIESLSQKLNATKHVNRAMRQELGVLKGELGKYEELGGGLEGGDRQLASKIGDTHTQCTALLREAGRLQALVRQAELDLGSLDTLQEDIRMVYQRDQGDVPVNSQGLKQLNNVFSN